MKAVVWTDVDPVRDLHRRAPWWPSALLVGRLPGGWGQLVTRWPPRRASSAGRPLARPRQPLHPLGRPHRRDVPHHRLPRRGPADGPALPVRPQPARGRPRGSGHERRSSCSLQFALFLLIGVGPLRLLPGLPARRRPSTARTASSSASSSRSCPPGMVGLVLGAVFAAAMSTLSSSLNSSATAAVTDFYRPLVRPGRLLQPPPARDPGLHPRLRPRPGRGGPRRAARSARPWWSPCSRSPASPPASPSVSSSSGIFTPRVGQRAALVGLLLGLLDISAVAFGTRAGVALVHARRLDRHLRPRPAREPDLARGPRGRPRTLARPRAA